MIKSKVGVARDYIEQNFGTIQSLGDVAKHIGCNYHSLREVFSKEMGIPLGEYLNLVRCSEAKRLLRTTDWKLYSVALELGFRNDKYFIKVFKKVNGLSPNSFRNNRKNNM